MKTMSFLASATVLGATTSGVRAFQSPILKSLTQLVGGGGSSPSRPSGPVTTTRDGVKRHLFNSIFGAAGKGGGIDYSTLKGMAAKEAAEYALAGQVKDKSKDGHEIATFAGGCFWGLELAYQRVPGVIDTSVGYTQGKEVCCVCFVVTWGWVLPQEDELIRRICASCLTLLSLSFPFLII